MLDYELNRIRSILTGVLGEPKNEPYSSGWQSYNCPYCAESDGVESDGKYNLETNVEHGCVFHCWKCETKGKLSKIIRDFGNEALMNEYREVLNTIRSSKMYQLDGDGNMDDLIEIESCVTLPKEYTTFSAYNPLQNEALAYLHNRGITDDIIKKYGIGYTSYPCANYSHRNRIIIPSYDSFGCLNYWVGRDYTGTNKVKYCNPKIPKTSVVFNEGMVNWYEDITLVEGPFDHIVVPNSIPLLGKTLTKENLIYQRLLSNAMAEINIMLDDDAVANAYKMYRFLTNNGFKNRVNIIICPKGYDASLMYEKFGKEGIIRLLRSATKVDEFTLSMY